MNSIQNEFGLTNREKRIFEFMKKRRTATLDEIIKGIREEKALRNSVNASVKLMGFKLQLHGWKLSRTTGVGRGAKAVYSLEEDRG